MKTQCSQKKKSQPYRVSTPTRAGPGTCVEGSRRWWLEPAVWSRTHCVHAHSCLALSDPTDFSLPGFLSVGFPRQEYGSGLPFPPPGDLPNLEIKPKSPALADSLPLCQPGSRTTWVQIPALQMYKLGLEKAEEPEIKLPTSR